MSKIESMFKNKADRFYYGGTSTLESYNDTKDSGYF